MSDPKLLRALAIAMGAMAVALYVIGFVDTLSGARGAGTCALVGMPLLFGALAIGNRARRLEMLNAR